MAAPSARARWQALGRQHAGDDVCGSRHGAAGGVAGERGAGQERALGVVHAGDGRAQHLFEHQVGAVVGMQARAQVGQAAGGRQQHRVARRRTPAPAWRRPAPARPPAPRPSPRRLGRRAAQRRAALDQRVARATAGGMARTAGPRAGRRPRSPPSRCPAARPAPPAPRRSRAGSPAGFLDRPSIRSSEARDWWADEPGRVQRVAPADLVLVDDSKRIVRHLICSSARLRQAPPTA